MLFSLVTPHSDNKSASQILANEELKQQLRLDPTPPSKQELKLDEDQQAEQLSEEPQVYLGPAVRIPGLIVEPFIQKMLEGYTQKKVKVQYFLSQLREAFPRLNKAIIHYFESRTLLHPKFSDNQILYDPPIAPHMPTGFRSKFVNSGSLAMLYLAIDRLRSVTMTRLYNSQNNGFGVNRLVHHWCGYNAPTLLICEARDATSGQKYVIGVYCDEEIKDKARFHGNPNNCLFQLEPTFEVLRANGEGSNYQYMNSRKIEFSVYGCGIGFGGDYSDHRFWIDGEDIQAQSFVTAKDKTYAEGSLVGSSRKIRMRRMELWGLGGKGSLQQQAIWRQRERERKHKSSQGKEELLNSEFNKEFLLGGWQKKQQLK